MDEAETAVIRQVARSGQRPAAWAGRLAATGPAIGRHASDSAVGLASMSFLIAALRRRAVVWCVAAAVGLALGSSLYVLKPPAYTATAQAFLTPGPNENLNDAIETNVALAESRPVALGALRRLGLHESVSSLLGSYTATAVTSEIISITVKAPAAGQAVRTANSLTTAFLRFRADQLRVYAQLVSASAGQELAKARAQAGPLTTEVSALSGKVTTTAQKARLSTLQAQLTTLGGQQASARSVQQSVTAGANLAVRDSRILNTATLGGKSRKKTAVIYALTGLIGGLFLSMGAVVVGALVSGRLRARDDIAHALGGPVRLSVGPVRLGRLPWRRLRLSDTGHPAIQRIAAYLEDGLPGAAEGGALAIVPADRPEVPALALAALALACSRGSKRVIVADLWPGSPAARLFGVSEPGVHPVAVGDPAVRILVVVPERRGIGPTGPLAPAPPAQAGARRAPAQADLTAAHSSADILLTLAALDPVLGSDHLSTWADDVAVVVTAGRATWTRVQAVGEMIRLADAHLAAGVLIGADQGDESLGQAYAAEAPRNGRLTSRRESQAGRDADAPAAENGAHPGAEVPS